MTKGKRFLKAIGDYFPEGCLASICAYFTLGETILPVILPGSPDVRDVPAVIVSAIAGYALAKLGRKAGFNEAVFSVVQSYEAKKHDEPNSLNP